MEPEVVAETKRSYEVPVIRKLEKEVVNRIAAGEVIQRPASALKELIENCLDARSTRVGVVLKEGGMKMLQVTDNGCGIRREDFEILCERHTTSKLTKYEDLNQIATFGFRGEALASITHVAHVTITSMTAGSPCAYKACYSDGKLVPPGFSAASGPAPSSSSTTTTDSSSSSSSSTVPAAAQPRATAGLPGTVILAEDLFYNVPIRRAALKSASDEYKRCLEVVTKYALHYSGVSFTCKKHGETKTDVHTANGATKLDNVKVLYGQQIARELVPLNSKDETHDFAIEGLVTNANYNVKKLTLILFINNRLVESTSVRKTIETVYAALLPRNTHPFVYLSVRMNPLNLDVNVHPTKKEVKFLYEDELLECLQQALEKALAGANSSRAFYTQAVLPGAVRPLAKVALVTTQSSDKGSSSTSTFKLTLDDASTVGDGSRSLDAIAADADRAAAAAGEHDHGGGDGEGEGEEKASPARPVAAGGGGQRKAIGAMVFVPHDGKDEDFDDLSSGRPHAEEEGEGDGDEAKGKGKGRAQKRPRGGAPGSAEANGNAKKKPKINEHELVRTDSKMRSLDAFLTRPGHDKQAVSKAYAQLQQTKRSTVRKPPPVQLLSVTNMLSAIDDAADPGLQRMMQEHTFVGCVDHRFCLVQHGTKLFLLHLPTLSKCFFYEQAVRGFASFKQFELSTPAPIKRLLRAALDSPHSGWSEEDGDKDSIAEYLEDLLSSKSAMLEEYFGLTIKDGALHTLPQLIPRYEPPLAVLPLFLLRLGVDVNWKEEQPCFENICQELAGFYQLQFGMYLTSTSTSNPDTEKPSSSSSASSSSSSPAVAPSPSDGSMAAAQSFNWMVEHVVFPAMRHGFCPPRTLAADGSVLQVAALEQLYKIFERC